MLDGVVTLLSGGIVQVTLFRVFKQGFHLGLYVCWRAGRILQHLHLRRKPG